MTERPPPDEQQRKQRRRAHRDRVKANWPVSGELTLAGSGFIRILLVVLVWWVFHQQSLIEVPDLVGVLRVVAVGQLKGQGLNLDATYSEDSDQQAGTVLGTDSPVGTKLDHSGGVRLLAIPGSSPAPTPETPAPEAVLPPPPPPPQQIPVPNVVGYDLATAARMLRQNGLTVGSVTEEESNLTATGDVLRTEPTAGTKVQPHNRVNLVVAKSKGPVLRRVPNVVGYDQATAARMLRQNGLTVGSVTEEESNQRAAGDVLRTEPTDGTEVQPHSRINLVVAKSVIVR